ncbi:MAG TPA: hypothetical protein VHE58_00990 [Burkholderiales bacterium]|nr:hypothetical protein [Burkholderiales bacterium]
MRYKGTKNIVTTPRFALRASAGKRLLEGISKTQKRLSSPHYNLFYWTRLIPATNQVQSIRLFNPAVCSNRNDMSEWLYLDTFSLKTRFGRPLLVVLQVACADFGHAREFVVARALDNVYPGHIASDPLSVLIESKRDIGSIKLPVADALPGTMRAAEYRMRIPASKESTIRRKGKKVLPHTTWATG